jgi:hypothetical protein
MKYEMMKSDSDVLLEQHFGFVIPLRNEKDMRY